MNELDYKPAPVSTDIDNIINNLKTDSAKYHVKDILLNIFNFIDLTSLNTSDTTENIATMTRKVNDFKTHFPDYKNVAAICIYPSLVSTVKQTLTEKEVKIASVSAGFPSSQTFLSVKAAESELCINKGANEIDVVISVGTFLEKEYKKIGSEIQIIKHSIGNNHLKVILETGELKTIENIYNASLIAMESGADFIKTSTGKTPVSATPEAVYTMCYAIKQYYEKTGKKIGIKPSGGISTSEDVIIYYQIVEKILGESWLNNKLFRIGASRLANSLLTDIKKIEGNDETINYF